MHYSNGTSSTPGGRLLRATQVALLLGALAICSPLVARSADLQTQHAFQIPAQSLDTALLAFSDQAKVQVLMWANAQPDAKSPGVSGELTALAALKALLNNTGLGFRQIDTETVAIIAPGGAAKASSATDNSQAASPRAIRLAQVDERGQPTRSERNTPGTGEPGNTRAAGESVAEVVVTGTRIAGATQSAAVQSVGREQFRMQGATSLQDVLRDIPAIFSGDYTGEATGAGQGGGITNNAYNRGRATAPNIHGLGAPATLSLLNGRRLPTASNGYSVDLSMVPLLALQRVDVLADGASPIYGADAIAGVVNLITRRNEDAIETRVRIGAPTQPGYEQLQLGQTFGKRWDGGSAFIAYQYDDQEALRAYQRDRTSNLRFNTFVMPEQTQHSAFAQVEHQVTDSLRLGAEGLWAKRDFAGDYSYFGGLPLAFDVSGDQYMAALTANLDLTSDWSVASFAQFAGADSEPVLLYGSPNPMPVVVETFEGEELTIGSTLSGSLFELGSGKVRAALGAEYREENRTLSGFGDGIKPFDVTRRVRAAFAEIQVPVLDRVEVSAAIRHDDYSDLGTTTNPKFGVRWEPLDGLNLRATYSTSFRALSLKDAYGQVSAGIYRFVLDAAGTNGQSLALLINGNPSSSVRPEESDNYTIGIDFSPPQVAGLSLSATFFSVSYDGRLVSPNQAVTDILNMNLPDTAPFITRNPSLAQLQALLANAAQVGSFTGMNHTPDQVRVLIDNRFVNLSKSEVRGVDLDLLWNVRTAGPSYSFFSRTTYGLDYLTAASPSLPEVERIGTAFYPAKLRTRTGAVLQQGIFHAGLAVNYTDGFIDDRVTPRDNIGSWTTVDVNVGADIGAEYGVFGGLSVELVARNVLDEDPPYLLPAPVAPTDLPNYDPANASVIGRTISLQMTKRW